MRILFWIFCASLAACGSENLYEGFKSREATRDPLAAESGRSALPPYAGYEAERHRLLDSGRK